jgi:hypothetical protein
MFLLLLFLESIETMRFYLACFQWSAAGSQAGDSIWCNRAMPRKQKPRRTPVFAGPEKSSTADHEFLVKVCPVDILANPLPASTLSNRAIGLPEFLAAS